jgi:hypothetical protein
MVGSSIQGKKAVRPLRPSLQRHFSVKLFVFKKAVT